MRPAGTFGSVYDVPGVLIVAVPDTSAAGPKMLYSVALGTPVQLKVLRDRQEQLVALEISELKDPEPKAEPAGSRFGLTLDAVTKELVKQFNLKTDEGVVITNV